MAVDEHPFIISNEDHDLFLWVVATAYGPARYLEDFGGIWVPVKGKVLRMQEHFNKLPVLMGKEWGRNAAELKRAVILVKGTDNSDGQKRKNEQLKEQVVAVCCKKYKAKHTHSYEQKHSNNECIG